MNAARRSTQTATAAGVAKQRRRQPRVQHTATGHSRRQRHLVAARRDRSGPREHARRARRILGTCRPIGPTPTLAPSGTPNRWRPVPGISLASGFLGRSTMKPLVKPLMALLKRSGFLESDLDYHLVRASMVIIFAFFGYQKWFDYEARELIPYISNGPLISWMYPVFGIRGASWFLGVSEWVFGALIFLGFWNKSLGVLGAAGSCFTFLTTVTIIPFMPDGWAASAGGFPAMTGN